MDNGTLKSILAAILVGILFAGCGQREGNRDEGPNVKLNGKVTIKTGADAESIALVGERLFYSPGIVYSNAIFQRALKKDPTNVRARFYSAQLSPIMTSKGILKRIRPFTKRLDTEDHTNSVQLSQETAKIPTSPIKDFLLDGQEDIVSETDLQNHFGQLRIAYKNLRSILDSIKNESLRIYPVVQKDGVSTTAWINECAVTKLNANTFHFGICDHIRQKSYNVGYADFEAMRAAASGMMAYYLTLTTSYNLKGIMTVSDKIRDFAQNNPNTELTDKVIMDIWKAENQLGRLVDVEPLHDILRMGQEGVQAARWALSQSDTLCPLGMSLPGNRPGALFQNGICIVERDVRLVESHLRGPTARTITSDDFKDWDANYNPIYVSSSHTSLINVRAFLTGSVTDMKDLLPNRFNQCGRATDLPDHTMGGVFTNADVVDFVRVQNPSFLNRTCEAN